MFSASVEVMGWWGWAAAAAAAAAWVAVKVLEVLWWRPRRVEEHFARQGITGPRYRFLVGCVREMVALMVAASAKPMPPPYRSHNVLPRVLAFYHHWKKIYGNPPPPPLLLNSILSQKQQPRTRRWQVAVVGERFAPGRYDIDMMAALGDMQH